MPIDDTSRQLFMNVNLDFWIKVFFILFIVFYIVFAFVLNRQIQLMGRALPTQVVPVMKFVALVNIGAALAILFIVIGIF